MTRVTAIIPVYNGAAFLAETIESVLAQDRPVDECIVVDDGSTDGSAAIASSFGEPVRVVRKANGGVAAARNTGLAEATGDLVAFLDADDRWLAPKTAQQVAMFEARPNLALVYTAMRLVRDGRDVGLVAAPVAGDALRNSLLLESPSMSIPSTAMARTGIVRAVGGFDERLSTSADTDLGCRVAAHHEVDRIEEPLVLYRLHDAQMHHDTTAFEHDMNMVIEKLYADAEVRARLGDFRRRARANLHAAVAGHAIAQRELWPAVAHLARAMRQDPARTLALAARRLRVGHS